MSTGDNAANAESVEAGASVTTGEYAVDARSVEGLVSVRARDNSVGARIVEAPAFVSTRMKCWPPIGPLAKSSIRSGAMASILRRGPWVYRVQDAPARCLSRPEIAVPSRSEDLA